MKKFIAIALLTTSFLSLNSFASDLNCAKSGAKILMDKKNVVIEAANIPMTVDLRELALSTSGFIDPNTNVNVSLIISFPKKDLKCSKALPKVFNCSGSTKKASVTVSVTQQSMMGSSRMQAMKMPVHIENIDISSSIGAQGPIAIGSGPTTVNLDQVSIKSSMFVKMGGDFQLDLEQSFKSGSECK